MIPAILAPSVDTHFQSGLKLVDENLKAVFNCQRERFEIYRYSRGRFHHVMIVKNDDGSFRPLDNRTIRELREMDIIAKYGSIANFEASLAMKKKKYQQDIDKQMEHELKWDLKDDKRLWHEAAENASRGIINPLPQEKDKKIISYPKGE